MKTKSDFPRRIEGTLTVHWKHLAAESAARRLLLSCSGAGSTELSPKPAGPYEGFGRSGPTGTKCRCNSPRQIEGTLTVHLETSGSRHWCDSPDRSKKVTSPGKIEGTLTVHRKHLASAVGDCCSPAPEQGHRAQSKNQQNPTKIFGRKTEPY